jgi:hypothetical protein
MNTYDAAELVYKNGYEAGKQAAAKELLEELDETLTTKLEAFNKVQEDSELTSSIKRKSVYWLGRAVTCGEILRVLKLLKQKYGVK